MEVAKIAILFKIAERDNISNYRLIAILSVSSNMFEKFLLKRIFNFF